MPLFLHLVRCIATIDRISAWYIRINRPPNMARPLYQRSAICRRSPHTGTMVVFNRLRLGRSASLKHQQCSDSGYRQDKSRHQLLLDRRTSTGRRSASSPDCPWWWTFDRFHVVQPLGPCQDSQLEKPDWATEVKVAMIEDKTPLARLWPRDCC